MTVSSFVTSTPHKANLSLLADETEKIYRPLAKKKKNHSRLAEFSDEEDVLNDTPTPSSSSSKKKERRKSRVLNTINENLNVSVCFSAHYSLIVQLIYPKVCEFF